MSLAEILAKKKGSLQQTQTRELNTNLVEVECKTSEDYHRLMKDTQFEVYYDLIKPYTFNSTLFPLNVETALSLRLAYKALHSVPPEPYDWQKDPNLITLAGDIDKSKAQNLTTRDIFVRLSSRSPKDAAIGARGIQIYTQAKEKIRSLNDQLQDKLFTEDNTKLHALYITGTEALRIQTGAQAVDLLVNSNRIQDDLENYCNHPQDSFNVVVREFANFEVELEFRGFVYGKTLTAITQYNQFCYFPRVVKYKEYLLGVMKTFIEKELVTTVPLGNFVIDIMLVSQTPDQGAYSNLKVYIVEINPFAEFAGEGLFSWTYESHILKGKAPFEFRVVEKPPKDAIKLIDAEWRMFISTDI
jgi:hypothetical protein